MDRLDEIHQEQNTALSYTTPSGTPTLPPVKSLYRPGALENSTKMSYDDSYANNNIVIINKTDAFIKSFKLHVYLVYLGVILTNLFNKTFFLKHSFIVVKCGRNVMKFCSLFKFSTWLWIRWFILYFNVEVKLSKPVETKFVKAYTLILFSFWRLKTYFIRELSFLKNVFLLKACYFDFKKKLNAKMNSLNTALNECYVIWSSVLFWLLLSVENPFFKKSINLILVKF